MRRVFVAASRTAFNALYRVFRKRQRENLVVFLSRQANEASYDFVELAREFEKRGWTCIMHLKKVRARNMVPYAVHVARELRLLGRCKIAVLDRYDPVVSLLNFECEPLGEDIAATCAKAGVRNTDIPKRPIVIQIWHAFGAYKKFGFQSVDTLEGHSADFVDAYDIHRNYSWVLCSGTGARDAFAEAFSCPRERVACLVRPEYDELMRAREKRDRLKRECGNRPSGFTVLMAPTLRKSHESAHPFRDLYEDRTSFEEDIEARVVWSFHPLEEGLPAPGNVSAQLLEADCLVTDYSSIAYEACVLGVPTLFYLPDLDSYRTSPGLNADPSVLCPEICFSDADELKRYLIALARDPSGYPESALATFAATGFDEDIDDLPGSAASRIVDFALENCPE